MINNPSYTYWIKWYTKQERIAIIIIIIIIIIIKPTAVRIITIITIINQSSMIIIINNNHQFQHLHVFCMSAPAALGYLSYDSQQQSLLQPWLQQQFVEWHLGKGGVKKVGGGRGVNIWSYESCVLLDSENLYDKLGRLYDEICLQ